MKKLMKVFQVIGRILNIVSVAALLVMIGVTIADVFMREVGDLFISIAGSAGNEAVAGTANRLSFIFNPVTGAVEITRMMMVCMTPSFVAALMNNRHVTVGLFVDKLPRKGQLAFDVLGYGASAIVCALMCYQGFIDMSKKILQNQVYTMLKIPTWPFYLVFAVAMGFFAIAIVVRLIDKFVDKDSNQPIVDQAAAAADAANKEVTSVES